MSFFGKPGMNRRTYSEQEVMELIDIATADLDRHVHSLFNMLPRWRDCGVERSDLGAAVLIHVPSCPSRAIRIARLMKVPDGLVWIGPDAVIPFEAAVHWMPLPTPPREVAENE